MLFEGTSYINHYFLKSVSITEKMLTMKKWYKSKNNFKQTIMSVKKYFCHKGSSKKTFNSSKAPIGG